MTRQRILEQFFQCSTERTCRRAPFVRHVDIGPATVETGDGASTMFASFSRRSIIVRSHLVMRLPLPFIFFFLTCCRISICDRQCCVGVTPSCFRGRVINIGNYCRRATFAAPAIGFPATNTECNQR